jgi:hypothetical protein
VSGPEVTVTAAGPGRFVVVVRDGATSTEHTVTVPEGMAGGLGTDDETLVRRSFAFLLEREPAGSILRRFDLPVIGRYFPEYEQEIRRRLP